MKPAGRYFFRIFSITAILSAALSLHSCKGVKPKKKYHSSTDTTQRKKLEHVPENAEQKLIEENTEEAALELQDETVIDAKDDAPSVEGADLLEENLAKKKSLERIEAPAEQLPDSSPLIEDTKTEEVKLKDAISPLEESIPVVDEPKAPDAADNTEDLKAKEEAIALEELEKKKALEDAVIKNIIEYEADSMAFDIRKNKVSMLGNSKVLYGKEGLVAHKVSISWGKNILFATSKQDAEKKVALEDKILLMIYGREFFAEALNLNLESQRAVLKMLFTKIEDGFFRANKVKRSYDDVLYVDKMTFTTCNLLHPHFNICAERVKIQEDDKIVSGSAYFQFDSVPMTLGMVPIPPLFFGIFFFPDKKHGIIPPRYGGNTEKGLHVKEFGYYWNFDDLVDLSLTTDIHTGGTLGLNADSFYKKRYNFSGNVQYKYEKSILDDTYLASWRFLWKHSTENNRVHSLAIDLDLQNDSYLKELKQTGESQNATKQSSIKYTNKLPDIPLFSLGSKISYSKNTSKGEESLTLPELMLYTQSIYPFHKPGAGGNFYKNLNFRYSIEFKNRMKSETGHLDFFEPKDWPLLYENKKYGVKNTIPIKANVMLGYFNLIPFAEYREVWYWDRLDHFSEPKKVDGFERVWDYEVGTELTTTFYGTFLFEKNKAVEAVRHQVKPSLKLIYTPTFEKKYWQMVDSKQRSRFEDYVFETPSNKEKLVLHGTLGNVLEMKLRTEDQEGNLDAKKVSILESFDIKGSYDFLDKEFPVGDLEFKARTRLFENTITIEASQTYDMYAYELGGDGKYTRNKVLAIKTKPTLGHVKNARLTINAQFSSKKRNDDPEAQMLEAMRRRAAFENAEQTAQTYVDFSIPWTFGVKYDYVYNCPTPHGNETTVNKIISAETTLGLSEKWQLALRSGYDFSQQEIVKQVTRIGVVRDLHCWQMEFSWLPISPKQYFSFSIGIKAPILQAIKYSRGEKPYTYV